MYNFNFIKKNFLLIFIFIFFFILFLSYEDPYENIFLVLCTISLIYLIKRISKISEVKSLVLLLILFLFVYMISVTFLYSRKYTMKLVNNNPSTVREDKAVLLVYEGESTKYNLDKCLTNILLQDRGIERMKAPILLYRTKARYQRIGKSDYKENTLKVHRALETVLSDEYKVYIGYLYDHIYIEEAIFEIVNDGYRKIIVVPVLLTEDDEFNNLKNRIEKLKLYNLNIQIKYTEALWNSEAIVNTYINTINNNITLSKIIDTGIILISEGCERYNDVECIKAIKQNIMFMEKISGHLIQNIGLDKTKVRICWFEYVKPSYTEEVKNLFEYGVGKILCIYVKPSVTNIQNSIIAFAIKNINIPEGVNIKILDGFLMDKVFIEELKRRIEFADLQNWN